MLEILYQDEDIIAINKPHGLLVHRSSIAREASEFALQLLRDQIGQPVYPAHRLDRKHRTFWSAILPCKWSSQAKGQN